MVYPVKYRLGNVIGSLFIFLFVYTAVSKLFQFELFQSTLYKSPLIGGMASFIAYGLPFIELLAAALLFFKRTLNVGFYLSLLLMVLFTVYISYMLLFEKNLPCSCGGVLNILTWRQHLFFNCLFTGLAIMGVLFSGK
jgi:hypothetical protein